MPQTREASLEPAKRRFGRTLLAWGTLVIPAHFAVVIWHLTLLVKVQPEFPRNGIVALILTNLVTVAGLVVFAKGLPKSGATMIVIPLGIALSIGTYTHFLSAGSDNVLRMPATGLTLAFQASAVLLTVLEALGCWIGVRMFLSTP
jgi:hypothetical protein